MYYAGVDDERVVRRGDPYPDRDPDAQLQHVPFDLDRDDLRAFLDHHLRCQVRDCYVGMGVDPPEEYRVIGPGLSTFTLKYVHFEFYPDYHEPGASVPGHRESDVYGTGLLGGLLDLL